MSEKGSAIISAIAGITMATLIALSTLTLGMSAINTMVIRDAAIEAAHRSALAEGQGQRDYLVRLLDESLPSLASYTIEETSMQGLYGFKVVAKLPGLGLVPFAKSEVDAVAVREAFL